MPLQGATAPTRDTQGVATLALGYVLHWAFSPHLQIRFYHIAISNEAVCCGLAQPHHYEWINIILTLQVRAESPMEHIAQGKRSDTLGLPMLEQSRPVRAKALKRALDFYRTAIFPIYFPDARRVAPIRGSACVPPHKVKSDVFPASYTFCLHCTDFQRVTACRQICTLPTHFLYTTYTLSAHYLHALCASCTLPALPARHCLHPTYWHLCQRVITLAAGRNISCSDW